MYLLREDLVANSTNGDATFFVCVVSVFCIKRHQDEIPNTVVKEIKAMI